MSLRIHTKVISEKNTRMCGIPIVKRKMEGKKIKGKRHTANDLLGRERCGWSQWVSLS